MSKPQSDNLVPRIVFQNKSAQTFALFLLYGIRHHLRIESSSVKLRIPSL